MARPYRVLGPIEIPWGDDRYIETRDLGGFWSAPEQARPGISTSHGIYLFAMRAGHGYTPWYVGKTSARRGFSDEVCQPHKLGHYNAVVHRYQRGTPVLFLIYPVTEVHSSLRKPSKAELNLACCRFRRRLPKIGRASCRERV